MTDEALLPDALLRELVDVAEVDEQGRAVIEPAVIVGLASELLEARAQLAAAVPREEVDALIRQAAVDARDRIAHWFETTTQLDEFATTDAGLSRKAIAFLLRIDHGPG